MRWKIVRNTYDEIFFSLFTIYFNNIVHLIDVQLSLDMKREERIKNKEEKIELKEERNRKEEKEYRQRFELWYSYSRWVQRNKMSWKLYIHTLWVIMLEIWSDGYSQKFSFTKMRRRVKYGYFMTTIDASNFEAKRCNKAGYFFVKGSLLLFSWSQFYQLAIIDRIVDYHCLKRIEIQLIRLTMSSFVRNLLPEGFAAGLLRLRLI